MANTLPANGEIPFCMVINRSSPPPVPIFNMFGDKIPADVCPLFDLKRHSFLFVIDKEPPRRVSLSGGLSYAVMRCPATVCLGGGGAGRGPGRGKNVDKQIPGGA